MSVSRSRLDVMDLNLLRLFDAIYREGSLQAACAALRVSQPTASHALSRLRDALGDELFIRSARGMVPTARAEDIAGPVREALLKLELGLQPRIFDPRTEQQSFRIAADNCAVVSLTGAIVQAVSRQAPGIVLKIRPSGTINPDDLIENAELDMFIGRPSEPRERFASEVLARNGFVLVHRPGLFPPDKDPSIEELAAHLHLDISSVGDSVAFVDDQLQKHGLTRRIAHSVPLLGCGPVLLQHDFVAVVREPIAKALCASAGLDSSRLPFIAPDLELAMRWHLRLDKQPAHVWLRGIVKDVVNNA